MISLALFKAKVDMAADVLFANEVIESCML